MTDEKPKKVYKVVLNSKGGKVIYVESLNRKRAVEAADRVLWLDRQQTP